MFISWFLVNDCLVFYAVSAIFRPCNGEFLVKINRSINKKMHMYEQILSLKILEMHALFPNLIKIRIIRLSSVFTTCKHTKRKSSENRASLRCLIIITSSLALIFPSFTKYLVSIIKTPQLTIESSGWSRLQTIKPFSISSYLTVNIFLDFYYY